MVQVKKADIMRQMGRPATAVEAGCVREDVASIQAESIHLDNLLAVCTYLLSPDLMPWMWIWRHASRVHRALLQHQALLAVKSDHTGCASRGMLRPLPHCVGCLQLRRKQFAALLHGLDALQMAIAVTEADDRDGVQ